MNYQTTVFIYNADDGETVIITNSYNYYVNTLLYSFFYYCCYYCNINTEKKNLNNNDNDYLKLLCLKCTYDNNDMTLPIHLIRCYKDRIFINLFIIL